MYFYFFLFLLFLSDIFVLGDLQSLPLYLALIFSPVFLAGSIIRRKSLVAPKVSIFYGLFLFFSALSIFFSVDKQISFETVLIYVAAFFVFSYTVNNQAELKQFLKPFIIYSSVIFILIFLIDRFMISILPYGTGLLFPGTNHLQLGNFLVLGALVTFPSFPLFYVFLFFILFSYSRTAYLSLSSVVVLFLFKNRPLISLFVLTFLLFFFLATSGIVTTPVFNFQKDKELLGKRHIFVEYALSSIKDRPVFGFGPGNFYFIAAKRQLSYNERSSSAHNLILDLAAENGLVAVAFFSLFLFGILKRAKKDLYLYLFLALSAIFLLDYTYRFSSILFLWFILLGLISKDKQKLVFNPLIVVLFALICELVILGHLFSEINPQATLNFYPLHKDAYIRLGYLDRLSHLYGENFIVTQRLAYAFDLTGKQEEALQLYQKTLELYPFKIVTSGKIIERILSLNMDVYGSYLGKKKTAAFLDEMVNEPVIKSSRGPIFSKVKAFCLDNGLRCYNIKDEKN